MGDLRLEGGTAEEESSSSSGSLERFRPLRPLGPRFAADILGRSGELWSVSISSCEMRAILRSGRKELAESIHLISLGCSSIVLI